MKNSYNDKKDERVNLSSDAQIELLLIQDAYRDLKLQEPGFEQLVNTLIEKYAEAFISDIKNQIRLATYRAKLNIKKESL